jgi:hypothetical protein
MSHRYASSTNNSYLYGWKKLQLFLASRFDPNNPHQTVGDIWSPFIEPARVPAWVAFLLFLRRPKSLGGAAITYGTARKCFTGINAVLSSMGLDFVPFSSFTLLVQAKKAWRLSSVPGAKKTNVTFDQLCYLYSLRAKFPLFVAISIYCWYTLARLGEAFSALKKFITMEPLLVRTFLPKTKSDFRRLGANLFMPTAAWSIISSRLTDHARTNPTVPTSRQHHIFQCTRYAFTSWLTTYLPRATGHSFRRGAAQYLFDAGVDLSVIQRKGRWTSEAWRVYIDTTASDAYQVAAYLPAMFPLSPSRV